jgi:predicted HAD superfamily phosphohydrolase YqeG
MRIKFFENLDLTNIKNNLIFLDIDGTLVPDNCVEMGEEILENLKILQKNNQVYLCTNSYNLKRNLKIEKICGIELLKSIKRKPSKKVLQKIPAKFLNLKKIVIGDKILIDGIFAKRIGAGFVKVKRKAGKDRFIIKIINLIDDIIYKIFISVSQSKMYRKLYK